MNDSAQPHSSSVHDQPGSLPIARRPPSATADALPAASRASQAEVHRRTPARCRTSDAPSQDCTPCTPPPRSSAPTGPQHPVDHSSSSSFLVLAPERAAARTSFGCLLLPSPATSVTGSLLPPSTPAPRRPGIKPAGRGPCLLPAPYRLPLRSGVRSRSSPRQAPLASSWSHTTWAINHPRGPPQPHPHHRDGSPASASHAQPSKTQSLAPACRTPAPGSTRRSRNR